MNTVLESRYYELPSVGAFLDRITEELIAGRSTLVLLPAVIPADRIRSLVSRRLQDSDVPCDLIDLNAYHREAPPASVIGEALGLRWPSPETPRTMPHLIRAMLATEHLPGVIHLYGFDRLPPAVRGDWIRLFMDWESVSRALEDQGRVTPLCVIVGAEFVSGMIPLSNVHLGIHEWLGFPSVLELRLLCRIHQEEDQLRAEHSWREHVLPSITGSDLTIISALWGEIFAELTWVRDCLLRIAEDRNWEQRRLQDALAKLDSARPGRAAGNTDEWKELWAAGLAHRTPEYGWELHPAALVVLGKEDDLAHRIWRGQAALVLPFVEQARLSLCDDLTRTYGPKWPYLRGRPERRQDERIRGESPRSCEWGDLLHLLQNVPQLSTARRQWLRMVYSARDARNTIAHYQPITFDAFKELWREVRKHSNQALISGVHA
jgi:hypothetical protein